MKKIIMLAALFSASFQLIAADKKAEFEAVVKQINPRLSVSDVRDFGPKGTYEVKLDQGAVLYFQNEGEYFFVGEMYQVDGGKVVNLTQQEESKQRKALFKGFDSSQAIVFGPKPPMQSKATIVVFTDVDCGYCRKLHQEVPALTAAGVTVKYVGFPRAGVGSGSYNKLVSAWCADDPQEALTQLKNMRPIAPKTCDNPVEYQYNYGKKLGINGTPAIVLENGDLIPGYKPAPDLIRLLGL